MADRLGVSRIHIHPHAGVLSALGIGLADVRHLSEGAVESVLSEKLLMDLEPKWLSMEAESVNVVKTQGVSDNQITTMKRFGIRYAGSDTALQVDAGSCSAVQESFEEQHRSRFGFISPEKELIVESMQVEAVGVSDSVDLLSGQSDTDQDLLGVFPTVMNGEPHETPFVARAALKTCLLYTSPSPRD